MLRGLTESKIHVEISVGGLPPKGGVRGGETGPDRGASGPKRTRGGLREALEALASRGAFGGGAFRDSKIHVEISLGGLPPQRGRFGGGKPVRVMA